MRSRHALASQTRAGRTRKAFRLTKQAARFALSLALLAQLLLLGGAPRANAQARRTPGATRTPAPTPTPTPTPVRGLRRQRPANGKAAKGSLAPASVKKVNFKQMARIAASMPAGRAASRGAAGRRAIPSPGRVLERGARRGLRGNRPAAAGAVSTSGGARTANTVQLNAASPSPSQSFLAQEDGPTIQAPPNFFTIPPDTTGAVGLDKVFTNTNSNYRVHDKLTGTPLETLSMESFWAPTGAVGTFDPRIQYDPYNDRWILCAVSDANSGDSSVLVAVSVTSDPQGDYFLYRIIVGLPVGAEGFPDGLYADFPMLGFNKNWITIGYNLFQSTDNLFVQGEILTLDYPQARAGAQTEADFFFLTDEFFFVHPATTYSPTEETEYLVQHLDAGLARYDLMTITGTPSEPEFTFTIGFTRPGGGWLQPFGDILPQNCVPGSPVPTFTCPATPRGIEADDTFVKSNVVFRNGKISYAQTVGIDNDANDVIDHTAAQWTTLNSDGSFFDGGRVEDATATPTNGGKWYSWPSLSVNSNGDMMMGFSEYESDDYADAGYTFRFNSDAAATMRDPVIYKEGEDYYDKDFDSGRNRWGDYSHTVVDPSNDADMWTIQEYAGTRVTGFGASNPLDDLPNGLGENNSRWSTWWVKLALNRGAPGDLVISEYRVRGTGGAEDEYVEIYNRTNSDITVSTTDGSSGYALAASDGVVRFTIPNGTVIPARGHFLGTNSDGYSLAAYPAGTATTATGDVPFTTDIQDLPPAGAGCNGVFVSGRGVALFNTADTANFSTATRFDAVGSVCETNTLYREGAGHAVVSTVANTQNAWVRDSCGKGGNAATFGPCPSNGAVVDNDNNAADFFFVDVEGLPLGPTQRLGAPGPENSSSPRLIDEQFTGFLLDATKSSSVTPNRVRTQAPTPETNDTFGTMELRRRIVNNTGGVVTRLRFRVVDTTTFPPVLGSGRADMRALTSSDLPGVPVNDPATCGASQVPPSTLPTPPCTVTIRGLTLESADLQPNGGGFNSSLSADSVTVTPLLPGQSINIRILLGVMTTGNYRFFLTIEALP